VDVYPAYRPAQGPSRAVDLVEPRSAGVLLPAALPLGAAVQSPADEIPLWAVAGALRGDFLPWALAAVWTPTAHLSGAPRDALEQAQDVLPREAEATRAVLPCALERRWALVAHLSLLDVMHSADC